MDHLKDDPEVWKIWSIGSQKAFYESMFRFRKDLSDKGVRALTMMDKDCADHGENPTGYAIFWPQNMDDVRAMVDLMDNYSFYQKRLCVATAVRTKEGEDW